LKDRKALLLLIFFLFLALPAANVHWIKHIESSGSASADLPEDLGEGEIGISGDDETYSDGVIDNFDYFVNQEYLSSCTKITGNTGSG